LPRRICTDEHEVPLFIEGRHVRALAVQTHAEVHHVWASILSFVLGGNIEPAVNTGAEARSFMTSVAHFLAPSREADPLLHRTG